MVEQPAFGLRLRELRRVRGLSQAQVAGASMSPSYVSLVESGRRTPNAELARALAANLGVPLTDLTEPVPDAPAGNRAHRLELIGRLIAARSARADGDGGLARTELESMLDTATLDEDEDVLWEIRWELAETLTDAADSARRAEVLGELLDDPLTLESPLLQARVATALAAVAREGRTPSQAIRYAERAVAAAAPLDATTPERVRAGIEILLACGESGEWEQGRATAEELLAIADDVPVRLLRGLVNWTAGSVLFLLGQPGTEAYFDRALELIGPDTDVRTWMRLSRAAAAHRVASGDLSAAQPLLVRARQATDLLGGPADRNRMAAVEITAALARDDLDGARRAAATMEDTAGQSYPDQPRCLIALARLARARRDKRRATDLYHRAASGYEESGAYRLAARAWREASAGPVVEDGPDPHALIMA
ncbi:DNA-binding XRE family transcriptional regulator [Krasilnikovia cinnamomea]|uniref:DNA-binding XRE family transcriptional regulator n=1 Tax=Krasilnikovia cinnamomea TaxID=349313 RepID=A0A4V2G7E8_9ACTN|nr:helix-turn-helix transcriptional regulator [Krasilnikovia cinnamomea]RZU52336.1 DNA-binding XRE family transcriptional regulator [Krasilnikovia cinnamomea]